MDFEKLVDKAEKIGWTVYIDEDGWDFRQYSPAGEDFSFFVSKSDVHSEEDMVREVRSYANDFDTEEHVQMWLEGRRNGMSGVPDLKTLAKDADDIKLMLNKLASALESVMNGEDGDTSDKRDELSPRQLERLDEIDNAMYRFLLVLLEKDESEFPWNMQYIGELVDAAEETMFRYGFDIHRPAVINDGDGGEDYVVDGSYHMSEEN